MDFNRVLKFWFGDEDLNNAAWLKLPCSNKSLFDDASFKIFMPYVSAAGGGYLSSWMKSSKSALSLTLLLDQFPRRIYTNSAAVFRFDELALSVSRKSLSLDYDLMLTVIERLFMYIPFLHSEHIEDQEEFLFLLDELKMLSTPEHTSFLIYFSAKATLNLQTLEKFGRFPQRNVVLRRASTVEELLWIEQNRHIIY